MQVAVYLSHICEGAPVIMYRCKRIDRQLIGIGNFTYTEALQLVDVDQQYISASCSVSKYVIN